MCPENSSCLLYSGFIESFNSYDSENFLNWFPIIMLMLKEWFWISNEAFIYPTDILISGRPGAASANAGVSTIDFSTNAMYWYVMLWCCRHNYSELFLFWNVLLWCRNIVQVCLENSSPLARIELSESGC